MGLRSNAALPGGTRKSRLLDAPQKSKLPADFQRCLPMFMNRASLGLWAILLPAFFLRAEEGVAFFESTVLPLLQQRCYECHSHEKKIKGGLTLDLKSGWKTGGEHGPAVVAGDLDKSRLIQAVRYADPELEMPPKGKLTASEIEVLEKWVAMGAPDPRVGESAPAKAPPMDLAAGRKFWAFQPVRDSKIPAVHDPSWALDPVDHFILAKLEAAGLRPNPDAAPGTWLRRVTLDLTGLPPTPGDLERFLAGIAAGPSSPDPYAAVVDRLLNSPRFGERWARHWLDLTGYADQIGTSNNLFAEHAWRYRDYVIDSFNADKPFNQFIREQIAGDLLPASQAEERAANLVATGFLVLGDVEVVNVDKLKMEVDLVDQQVSKVGLAFLGLTLGCARCHDHKFDPISQADYYAIAGMFRSTSCTYKTDHGVWSDVNTRELPETPEQLTARAVLLAEHEHRVKAMETERADLEAKKAALDTAQAGKEIGDLAARIQRLNVQLEHSRFFAPLAPKAFAVHDVEKPDDMRITLRGNPYALGEKIPRGVPRVAAWGALPPIPSMQSGRQQLADWIADERNPLTARVAVNRLWQKLFGEGLVPTVDYFGVRGAPPSHPELLDHLAVRFTRNGWSQKQILRRLVLSRAYRMSSGHNALALQRDADNRLLWRMNRQRLDAEAIRDSLLAVCGTLTSDARRQAMPLEFPENVSGLAPKGVNPPAFSLNKFRPVQEFQRTIYLPVIRSGGQPGPARLRDVFDFTQPAQMAGKRAETSVPTQSLFLMNSDQLRSRAGELARLVTRQHSDPEERLDALWLRVLNRPITGPERADALNLLDSMRTPQPTEPELAPWIELSHALLSGNEFLFRL